MATPNWSGATAGQPTLAGQVNQFLGTHTSTFIYAGAQQGGQTTLGSGSINTNGLYLAQSFVTGGSAVNVGRLVLQFGSTGSPTPLAISIQTNSGSAPSGTALATVNVPAEYVATNHNVTVPLPCSLGASTTYWIVFNAVGDVSNFFSWFKSNQVSGASTSANGSTWTAQSYGFYYAYYDQSLVWPVRHTWEDSGARWAQLSNNAVTGLLTNIQEYTTAQGSGQYQYSSRTVNYSGTALTSIA